MHAAFKLPHSSSSMCFCAAGDHCLWAGITCTAGLVTGLQLPFNGTAGTKLSGSLPMELSNLADVLVVNLFNNQLVGSLPPEWSLLPALEYLDLSNNTLIGDLPPTWSALTTLQHLDLSFNNFQTAVSHGISWLIQHVLSTCSTCSTCSDTVQGQHYLRQCNQRHDYAAHGGAHETCVLL